MKKPEFTPEQLEYIEHIKRVTRLSMLICDSDAEAKLAELDACDGDEDVTFIVDLWEPVQHDYNYVHELLDAIE